VVHQCIPSFTPRAPRPRLRVRCRILDVRVRSSSKKSSNVPRTGQRPIQRRIQLQPSEYSPRSNTAARI